MERETFQRALHMWPEWDTSIDSSRKSLEYEPTWPVEKRLQWIEANYPNKVRPAGEAELKRLDLPPNLQQYWEDCFYCDYRKGDGTGDFTRITRRIVYEELDCRGEKTGRLIPGNRSVPPLPYQGQVMWLGDEDIHGPWVRLEIMVHAPLATRDLIDQGVAQAWRTFRHKQMFRPPCGWKRHPLSNLILKAKANVSEKKRSAVKRFESGEARLLDLVIEEWHDPEVQAQLCESLEGLGRWEKDIAIRRAQKKILDRVRKWFPPPRPTVGRRSRWRDMLTLPTEDGASSDTDNPSRS